MTGRPAVEIGERAAVPERQRTGQGRRRSIRLAGRSQRPAAGDQLLEAVDIELVPAEEQAVSALRRLDGGRAQSLAQPGDADLHLLRPRGWWSVAPQGLGQLIGADHSGPPYGERGEHHPLTGTKHTAIDPQRAEQRHAHGHIVDPAVHVVNRADTTRIPPAPGGGYRRPARWLAPRRRESDALTQDTTHGAARPRCHSPRWCSFSRHVGDRTNATTPSSTVEATNPATTEADRASTTTRPDSAPVEGALADPAGRIAFGTIMPGHERSDQLMALYAIDPDGTDLVQLTEGNSLFPTWSPDGSRLAFAIVEEDSSAQIATISADGTDLRVLTSGPGIHEAPSWSPDGTWIAYDYSPVLPGDPTFHTVLYRMDADGSDQALLGDPDVFDAEPKISPDGERVLFQRYEAIDAPIMVRELSTGAERIVLPAGGQNPNWSPDGSTIIVQTDPPTGDLIWGPLVRR